MADTRKLAAILAADVAGFSRLTGADEVGTVSRLRALRQELIDPVIAAHRGRTVKTTGDRSIMMGSSNDPTARAQSERLLDGLRLAGVPEG